MARMHSIDFSWGWNPLWFTTITTALSENRIIVTPRCSEQHAKQHELTQHIVYRGYCNTDQNAGCGFSVVSPSQSFFFPFFFFKCNSSGQKFLTSKKLHSSIGNLFLLYKWLHHKRHKDKHLCWGKVPCRCAENWQSVSISPQPHLPTWHLRREDEDRRQMSCQSK